MTPTKKPKTKQAQGRNNRRKGAAWDNEVKALLSPYLQDAKRGFQTRGAKQDDVPDVTGTPWWIECKTGQIQWVSAIKQAMAECGDRPWMVFAKAERVLGSGSARVVMMDVETLQDLLYLIQVGADKIDNRGLTTEQEELLNYFIGQREERTTNDIDSASERDEEDEGEAGPSSSREDLLRDDPATPEPPESRRAHGPRRRPR